MVIVIQPPAISNMPRLREAQEQLAVQALAPQCAVERLDVPVLPRGAPLLEPIAARYRDLDIRRSFRGDAAFARPELYEYLEAEGYLYAIPLTTLRERLVKIGAKVVSHARYVIFQMAEVATPRRLFAAILERIRRLAVIRPRAQVPG